GKRHFTKTALLSHSRSDIWRQQTVIFATQRVSLAKQKNKKKAPRVCERLTLAIPFCQMPSFINVNVCSGKIRKLPFYGRGTFKVNSQTGRQVVLHSLKYTLL